jgi:hypothetical protein
VLSIAALPIEATSQYNSSPAKATPTQNSSSSTETTPTQGSSEAPATATFTQGCEAPTNITHTKNREDNEDNGAPTRTTSTKHGNSSTRGPTFLPPSGSPVFVGLANPCGVIDGVNYVCLPNSGLTCDTMPGQTQRICVRTSQLGGPCNNQFTKCATGLTCDIPFGQWAGTCVSGNPPPPTPPPVSVGLANPCGVIDGVNYVCLPNSGLTCDTMPGQTQKICVRTAQLNEPCNNQFTKCATGLVCSIPSGQWAGTCIKN